MDTADEIGSLSDCLYSLSNRVEIARQLTILKETELLKTALEDIFYSAQLILDNFCVKDD